MPYLILAQSQVTARALGAWLELLGEAEVKDPSSDSRCLVVEYITKNRDQGVELFETAASRISLAVADASPLPFTVLVDSVEPGRLDPLGESGSWDSLLAMLILTLPEVRWIFGVISGKDPWNGWHSLPSLPAKPWRNPLHDPTGLRNHVRFVANKNREERNLGLAQRSQCAAALDEEVHYAMFHAYTAYRFGYRADSVTSWQLTEELFDSKEEPDKNHGFHLLMEDVNLYFPDRPAGKKLSTFQEFRPDGGKEENQGRACHCKKLGYGDGHKTTTGEPLESSVFRIVVTSGHTGASEDTIGRNREYVKRHKPGGWGFVLKPTGGMFDLWSKARMFERLKPPSRGGNGGSRAGLAPGFVWPPDKVGATGASQASHSAPGKLMLVATHLIRRADALRTDANTVEECIRGAVLATDALELLGFRTPTLALQALELKQWFETKAEVAFVGVGHHFQLTRRFKEIERETQVAARFHSRGRRDAAALDASVTIANRLALIFRDAGQFDENEECLRKLRWWNRKLSFIRARNKPYLWPGFAVLAYAEWMISSLAWLLLSVATWMLLISLIWWAWTQPSHSWREAVQGAVGSFVGANVEPNQGEGIVFLSSLSSLLGFFHLGVFVSFLYSAIARK